MRSESSAMREAMGSNSTLLLKATLTLADGTVRELAGEDLMAGTASFESATSSDSSFDIGAVVVGKCSLTLNNHDGRFEDYDFTEAQVVPYVGKALSSGTEWLRMGTYVVDQPDSYAGTIQLDCLDRLTLLSRKRYAEVTQAYPCSPSEALGSLFTACGLTLDYGADKLNDDKDITRRPDDDMTCLQAAGYLAQMMGLWIRSDDYGAGLASWYPKESAVSSVTWGEATGTWSAATGTFATSGGSAATGADVLDRPYSSTTMTDDVVVTGVQVTASNQIVEETDSDGNVQERNGEDGETALAGGTGYVLAVSGNPFIEYGRAQEVANALYGRVGGMAFRPFSMEHPADPSIEAGDAVAFLDRNQVAHASYVTGVTLAVNRAMSVKCSAKSAARNSAATASASTRAVVRARNDMRRERTAREIAIAALAERIGEEQGLYHTEETQDDGSVVYYLHDKPTVAESKVVWKMTATAVAVSTDGGATYANGITADGNAVLNRIYAIGIDANHITTGRLSAQKGTNFFDLDTGEMQMASTTTVVNADGTTSKVVTSVDVLYAIGDSPTLVPTSGWSTEAPTWEDGKYIWSKTVSVVGGETTETEPVCITGAKGSAGTSVTVSSVAFAAGDSGTAAPDSGWQSDVPSVDQGKWLWCRTTYSDGTTAYTCSYIGTDGADGTSVTVRSVTKVDGTTTVVLADTDGNTSTLTINDGEDGSQGTPGAKGADGRDSYTHIAWAVTIDGSELTWGVLDQAWSSMDGTWADASVSGFYGFSTTDSANKRYIGVCEDSNADDPTDPTAYSWTLIKGADGESVTVSSVSYAIGADGTTAPSSGWQSSVPLTSPGNWLWCRVAFSDGTTSETCSYQGTDGADGKSVTVGSVTKSGRVTTVTLLGSDGTTSTMTIEDGQDGDTGAKGANGYVHVAWATSSDGSQGFSTSVSANKTYMGVYTDNTEKDSTTYTDYSWTLIKGAKGETGTGVSGVVEQYYLSTSSTSQTGGSWVLTQPTWSSGHYIWTRSQVTWTDGSVTYTDPVLADAINKANQTASAAKSTADANKTTLDTLNTQKGIFNKLTNNGQTQGIYLQDGLVYLNASYIKSGAMDADLITTGRITSKDGKSYWDLDTGEVELSISGGTEVDLSGYAKTTDAATNSQTIYYLSTSTTTPSAPTSQVTSTSTSTGTWTLSRPSLSSSTTQYLFQCTQYKTVDGKWHWSSVTRDYAATNAQSTANTAASNASSAVAVTNHISISSNGITVTGTNGNTVFSTTYGSDGFRTLNNVAGISTNNKILGIKDWGMYYGTVSGSYISSSSYPCMWLTTGSANNGHKHEFYVATSSGSSFNLWGGELYLNGKEFAYNNSNVTYIKGQYDSYLQLGSSTYDTMLVFNSRHYIQIGDGHIYCRVGSGGFGWMNGSFQSSLSFS